MNVYVFGNPLVPGDSGPERMLANLKEKFSEHTFIITDPNDSFPLFNERNPIIFDTIKKLSRPHVFRFEDLISNGTPLVSGHDYDLFVHLSLLKKLRRIDSVTIIGMPEVAEVSSQLAEELIKIFSSVFSTKASEL